MQLCAWGPLPCIATSAVKQYGCCCKLAAIPAKGDSCHFNTSTRRFAAKVTACGPFDRLNDLDDDFPDDLASKLYLRPGITLHRSNSFLGCYQLLGIVARLFQHTVMAHVSFAETTTAAWLCIGLRSLVWCMRRRSYCRHTRSGQS